MVGGRGVDVMRSWVSCDVFFFQIFPLLIVGDGRRGVHL